MNYLNILTVFLSQVYGHACKPQWIVLQLIEQETLTYPPPQKPLQKMQSVRRTPPNISHVTAAADLFKHGTVGNPAHYFSPILVCNRISYSIHM